MATATKKKKSKRKPRVYGNGPDQWTFCFACRHAYKNKRRQKHYNHHKVINQKKKAESQPTGDSWKKKYYDYLNSPEWKIRREITIRQYNGHCFVCGSTHSFNIHHLSYKNLGHELDEDLILLCRTCHERAHHLEK